MTSVGELLEEKARRLSRSSRDRPGDPLTSQLEVEIALALERVERTRAIHQEQLVKILRGECYVESDLNSLETYNPQSFRYQLRIRDNLKNRLMQLDKERRQLIAEQDREIGNQQLELLRLINRREQFDET